MKFTGIKNFGERGAALVEYGMLAGLVAVVSIAAVMSTGEEVRGTFSSSAATLGSYTGGIGGTSEELAEWNDFTSDAITGMVFFPGDRGDGWYGVYEPQAYGTVARKTGSPELVGVNYNPAGPWLHVNFDMGQSTFPAGFRDGKTLYCRTEDNADVFTATLTSADSEHSDAGYPYLRWIVPSLPELDHTNTGGNTASVLCEVRPS